MQHGNYIQKVIIFTKVSAWKIEEMTEQALTV